MLGVVGDKSEAKSEEKDEERDEEKSEGRSHHLPHSKIFLSSATLITKDSLYFFTTPNTLHPAFGLSASRFDCFFAARASFAVRGGDGGHVDGGEGEARDAHVRASR